MNKNRIIRKIGLIKDLLGDITREVMSPIVPEPTDPIVRPPTRPPTRPPVDPPIDDRDLYLPPAPIVVPTRFDAIASEGTNINTIIRTNAKSGSVFNLGVKGYHPERVNFCKRYGSHTKDEGPLSVNIVGLSKDAEIRGIGIYAEKGSVYYLGIHNIRLSTSSGGRSPIFDIAKSNTIIINNVYLLPDKDNLTKYGGAGMKWGIDLGDGSDYLHINNCKRAEDPRGGKVRFEEHWAYIKAPGKLYITNNDISGGNRTGFQIRTPGYKAAPHGPVVIEGNYADSYGFDWGFKNGGSCITVWESLKYPVIIRNNKITNAKYGCLVVAHQPPDAPGSDKIHKGQPQHLLNTGHAHSNVIIEGNIFENKNGDRHNVSINSSQRVQIRSGVFEGNAKGDINIDSKTAWKWGAPPCTNVEIVQTLQDYLNITHWNGNDYVAWK